MVSVKVNGPELKKILDQLHALANFDHQKMLNFMGAEAVDVDIHQAFENEKDPVTGKKWEPSKRAIEDKGKTLQDTRRLRKSIDYQPIGLSDVLVGTNVIYAAQHQEGTDLIPARPFLGVAQDFQQRVMRMPEVKRMLRI